MKIFLFIFFLVFSSFPAQKIELNKNINNTINIVNNFKNTRVVDGTYPAESINVSKKIDSAISINKCFTSNVSSTSNEYNFQINIFEFAQTKSEFLKYFKNFQLFYDFSWIWQNVSTVSEGNSSDNISITLQTSNYSSSKIISKNNGKSFSKFELGYIWTTNILKINFKITSETKRASGSCYYHYSQTILNISKIILKSAFDWNSYYSKLAGTSGSLSNALGNASKDGIADSRQQNALKIKIVADKNPSWYSSENLKQAEEEVKKRIVTSFDNNTMIVDYLTNFSDGVKTGLEITPIIPTSSGSSSKLQIKTQLSFYNWQTSKNQKWTFITDIDFSLSDEYWNKNIQQRVNFTAGKIIDSDGITVVDDIEEQINKGDGKQAAYNNGTIKYHTSVIFSFGEKKTDPNARDYDSVKINGVLLNGYNGQYGMTLEHLPKSFENGGTDGGESSSTYKIEIKHEANPSITGDKGGNYNVTIIIENNMDSLSLTMMNWGENNPDYKKLTSKTIKDPITGKEKENPDYDETINPKTGTKEQLIWINKKSIVPFALDPVSADNYLITSDNESDYDVGYIALASEVGGVGFSNFWNTKNFKSVKRYSSNLQLNTNSSSEAFEVKQNEQSVQTYEGMYHFTIESRVYSSLGDPNKTIPPVYMNKFMLVKNEYGDFINDVNNENNNSVVTSFWSTNQGQHLRSYMVNYKGWNKAIASDFSSLSYEAVIAYWRNYVSDMRVGLVSTDKKPDNRVDLSLNGINSSNGLANFGNFVSDIKTGQGYNTSELIVSRLFSQVKKQILDQYYSFDVTNPQHDKNGNIIKNYDLKNLVEGELQDYTIQYYDNNSLSSSWKTLKNSTNLSWFVTNQNDKVKIMKVKIVATNYSTIIKNESKVFNYCNNYDIVVDNLVNLGDLPLKDTIGNFSGFSIEKLFNNYINDYVFDAVSYLNQKNNSKIDKKDYVISSLGNGGSPIGIDDETLFNFTNKISSNLSEINSLPITVYSSLQSTKTEGSKIYQLVHNFNFPNVPDKPNLINEIEQTNSRLGKIVLFFIVFVVGILIAIGIILWKWRYSRHRATYNTKIPKPKNNRNVGFIKKKKDKH